MPAGRTLILSHHAEYACRHSGACCTSGWRIPVEPDRAGTIGRVFGDVFEERSAILRLTMDGACALYEPRGPGGLPQCAIQRTCGHAALPSACRHFPRVYLHDAYATRLTLSHYCPTAASLLFTPGGCRIEDAPPAVASPDDREGLDARDALPPLLRPGMLMDVDSYGAWEAGGVDLLMSGEDGPEASLARLDAVVETVRGWHPGNGALLEQIATAFGRSAPRGPRAGSYPAGWDDRLRSWFDLTVEAIPPGLAGTGALADAPEWDARFVADAWPSLSGPLRKYVASRLFGSWVAYQGRGLRTVVASLRCALAVVRLEAARACAAASRPLDTALLREAIRAAELLLVHKADSQVLASRLSWVEDGPPPAVC